jgi:hypothetical protein
MIVCGSKHERYGKWKRHSSTSFRPGLTVTNDLGLASLAQKKRNDYKLRLIYLQIRQVLTLEAVPTKIKTCNKNC